MNNVKSLGFTTISKEEMLKVNGGSVGGWISQILSVFRFGKK